MKEYLLRLSMVTFFLVTTLLVSLAQTGSIKGTIVDGATGEPLIGASVLVEGTTSGAAADLDGNFVINGLTTGTYSLRATYIAYRPQQIAEVVVEAGKETLLQIVMETDEMSLDEVVVVATPRLESERILMRDQQNATVIRESVGAQQLSLQGVSDIATATSKITGVVKSEGSGEVYVRGLGDRYVSTTMNDLPIPSDDVERKNIDLGLFSTGVIQNVGITKTYSTGSYADQTGGNINIVSKEFVDQFTLELQGGVNSSLLSNNQFGNFRVTPNLQNSLLTFYSREHNLVDAITKQSWDPRGKSLPLDFGITTTGGKEFTLMERDLTLFYTLSYKSDHSHTTGVYRRFNSNTVYSDFSDTETWSSSANLTGLLNLAYRFNNNHKINYNLLFINKLTDQVYEQGRNGNGFKFDMDEISNSFFTRDMNSRTTMVLVNQLLGDHRFSDSNRLEWGLGYNLTAADEPNRIRNYTGFDQGSIYFSYRIADFENRKSSQEIDDREVNGYIRNKLDLALGGHPWKLEYGLNYRNKQRDFSNQFVGVQMMGLRKGDDNVDDLTSLFTDPGFEPSKIKTIPPDLYNATLHALAGYVELGFIRGKLDGNAGLRYEYDRMDVQWDINNDDPLREPRIRKEYKQFYPGINLRYNITEQQALRLSGSRTITLPEFKEIAPFAYTSPNSTLIQGSPELKASRNWNADLKWEYFKSTDELISLGAFYKKIEDPINITSLTGGAGYLIYANTGKQAGVMGLEVEARLNLFKNDLQSLRMILNGTRMWVSQDLLEAYQYNNKTSSGLQGASELISNLTLSYSHLPGNWQASLSGNYSSDRIYAMGSPKDANNRDYLYNDEIIEKGVITLDAVVSKGLTDHLTVKLIARNLLNPEMQMTQNLRDLNSRKVENHVVESYKKGMRMQLSVNYTF